MIRLIRTFKRMSLVLLILYTSQASAGLWEAMFNSHALSLMSSLPLSMVVNAIKNDRRLALSTAFTVGAIGLFGYGLYERYLPKKMENKEPIPNRNSIEYGDSEIDPLQILCIQNIGRRIFSMKNFEKLQPCVDNKINNFVKENLIVPIILKGGERIWQPLALWQSITLNTNMNIANAEAIGINVQKNQEIVDQVRLGNALLWNKYVRRASNDKNLEGSIAGGSHSCGYHVLKNVICILNALHAGDNTGQYNLSIDYLLDLPYCVHLFGKDGIWREFIVEKIRKPQLLGWKIDKELSYKQFLIKDVKDIALNGNIDPARVLGIYRSIAANLNKSRTEKEVKLIMQAEVKEVELCRSVTDIKEAIKNNPITYEQKNEEIEDINTLLKRDDVIGQFVKDLPGLRNYTIKKDFTELAKEYNAFQRVHNRDQIDLSGENLTDAEMQELVDYQRDDRYGLLRVFKDVEVSIIQEDLDISCPDEEGTIIDSEIIQRIKKGLGCENYCHVLFVHGDGHWIAFIISKVNDIVDYIIVDSLNYPRYGADYVDTGNEVDNMRINCSEITLRIWNIIDKLRQGA